jgi:uncharacterized membrane protein YebE (DUF533 family)
MTIQSIGSSVKSNIVGAIGGSVALYFGAKKLMKVENKYVLIGLTLAGAVAGAMVQSKLKSKATIKPAIVGK